MNSQKTLAEFFTTEHQDFPEHEQNEWLDFAMATSEALAMLIKEKSINRKLPEILQYLGSERRGFARQHNHGKAKVEEFGQLRDVSESDSIEKSVERLKREREQSAQARSTVATGKLASTELSLSTTIYMNNPHCIAQISRNLGASLVCNDQGFVDRFSLDADGNGVLNQLLSVFMKVEPDTYFKQARYKCICFRDPSAGSPHKLTKIYFTENFDPSFMLMEHTEAQSVNQLLQGRLNAMLARLLEPDKTGFGYNLFYDFIWFMHHLMPYKRGSASIILILMASICRINNIVPRKAGNDRLDVDALSLALPLFRTRLHGLYQRQ